MLISKYGQPILNGLDSKHNTFYVIEGNNINSYYADDGRIGKVTKWKTEYLEIELFEGLKSNNSMHTKNGYALVAVPVGEIVTDIKEDKGEKPCFSYVYINYKLTMEAIKKLNLNEKKL